MLTCDQKHRDWCQFCPQILPENTENVSVAFSLCTHSVALILSFFSCSMLTVTCFRVAPEGILHSLMSLRLGEVQIDLAYHCTGCWVALHTVS